MKGAKGQFDLWIRVHLLKNEGCGGSSVNMLVQQQLYQGY